MIHHHGGFVGESVFKIAKLEMPIEIRQLIASCIGCSGVPE